MCSTQPISARNFNRSALLALATGWLVCSGCHFSPPQFEPALARFAKDDTKHQPAPGSVLFTGSSTIALWDMENAFKGKKIVNRGIGGADYRDIIRMADQVIVKYAPGRIFLYAGDNDIGYGQRAERVLTDAIILRELIGRKLPDVQVVFISIKPSIARWQFRKAAMKVNDGLKNYAAQRPNTRFVDVWTPALTKTGTVRTDIFQKDNLHMNLKGYAIWEKVIGPLLEE